MAFGIAELNVRYSDFIKDYLNKGYVISPLTIGNSFSGAKTFFDLINPKEKSMTYRVWLKDTYDDTYDTSHSFLKIEVRKYDRKNYPRTLWPDEGDIVNEKSFFVISEKGIYTDDEDEVERINKCRRDRRAVRESLDNLPYASNRGRHLKIDKLSADFIDNIMARINRVRGFKRANATCIKAVVLYKDSQYDWTLNKRVYRLKAQISFSYNNKTSYIYLG